MLNLHKVPSKEIRSEWVHVRFAFGSWDRLLLIECENSTIYFFRGWDHEPQFTLPRSQISDIIDSEVIRPKRKGMECRIEIKIHRQLEQPFMNRILQALKVQPFLTFYDLRDPFSDSRFSFCQLSDSHQTGCCLWRNTASSLLQRR